MAHLPPCPIHGLIGTSQLTVSVTRVIIHRAESATKTQHEQMVERKTEERKLRPENNAAGLGGHRAER